MIKLTKKDNKKITLYLPEYETKIIESILTKEEIELLIEQRKEARRFKNYLKADNIRNKLKDTGVFLFDKEDGRTVWDTGSCIGESLFRLDFNINRLVSKGRPDWGWLPVSYMLEIYSNPRKVTKYNETISYLWIETYSDIETMFDHFHLANSFVLHIKGKKIYLVNDWNEIDKVMLVGGKWKR